MAIFNTIYQAGEVSIKWWSPKMTADNAPSPYVASADSEYTSNSGGGTYYAFLAFDGKFSGQSLPGGWYSSKPNAWIQFDFGAVTSVAGVRMLPKLYSNWCELFPKSFTIHWSDDGENWTTLVADDGTDYDPYSGEWREIMFEHTEKHRYFRINCLSNYGQYQQSVIDEIQFAT